MLRSTSFIKPTSSGLLGTSKEICIYENMVTITSEINYMSIHIPATDSIDTLIKLLPQLVCLMPLHLCEISKSIDMAAPKWGIYTEFGCEVIKSTQSWECEYFRLYRHLLTITIWKHKITPLMSYTINEIHNTKLTTQLHLRSTIRERERD